MTPDNQRGHRDGEIQQHLAVRHFQMHQNANYHRQRERGEDRRERDITRDEKNNDPDQKYADCGDPA